MKGGLYILPQCNILACFLCLDIVRAVLLSIAYCYSADGLLRSVGLIPFLPPHLPSPLIYDLVSFLCSSRFTVAAVVCIIILRMDSAECDGDGDMVVN